MMGTMTETLWQVETNLDDATPEEVAFLQGRLLAAGARDAWIVPTIMKKGRPGFLIGALADERGLPAVERTMLAESSTLGIRRFRVERTSLARRREEVDTRWGRIGLKVATLEGEGDRAAPEYEEARAAAEHHGIPLRAVYEETLARWREGRS